MGFIFTQCCLLAQEILNYNYKKKKKKQKKKKKKQYVVQGSLETIKIQCNIRINEIYKKSNMT